MNLLCPNCQKQLTVAEQYAGQLMKCPLCNGTFTVPALPAAPIAPPETFSFKDQAPATPPSTPSNLTAPATEPSAPPAPPLPPGDYTRKMSLWFSPRVLQFAPLLSLLFIFLLQFLPWVGVYPGGVPYATENAWGAAIGTADGDPNIKEPFRFTGDPKDTEAKIPDNRPGWGWLMILYLFGFFPTFALTVTCVIISLLPIKLPSGLMAVLQWKWGLAFFANLLLLFVLALQLLAGFSLEASVKSYGEWVAKKAEPAEKRDALQDARYNVTLGQFVVMLQRTTWLHVVVCLHLLTVLITLILFWLSQRERFNKPHPVLELRW